MPQPLVTIICLCYNHASWVRETLDSAWKQEYPAIELIIVDDASTDGSVAVIQEWMQDKPQVSFIALPHNVGNCKAFNIALAGAKGAYIIDLAADDLLMPERVAVGVQAMEEAGEVWGVHFSDALYIDAAGKFIKSHYQRNAKGELISQVPQGWVYREVLERYFICTPTMMMRRSVLESLGGYDGSLAYEDFDLWVRSARSWKYLYTDKVLVTKRVLPRSWSARQYEAETLQLASTLKVCQKAAVLNENREEHKALANRLRFELRQAIRHRQWEVGLQFLELKKQVWPKALEDKLYTLLLKNKIPI